MIKSNMIFINTNNESEIIEKVNRKQKISRNKKKYFFFDLNSNILDF